MNKKEFKNLKDIKLSTAEKTALFERIKTKIGIQTLRYRVVSPFISFSYIITHRYAQVGVLALLFVVLSGATAFASLGTLPGDALYGVKTNVVENIPRILYRTPEQKAQHNFKNIEKRISEFEKLAEKGELSEKNTKTLEKEIEKNLGDFDAQIKEIKDQKKEEEGEEKEDEVSELGRLATEEMKIAIPEEKIELEEKLEETLEKHAEKIKEIREELGDENKEVLESIVERVDSASDLEPTPIIEGSEEEISSDQQENIETSQ